MATRPATRGPQTGTTTLLEYPQDTATAVSTPTAPDTSIWNTVKGYVLGNGKEIEPSVIARPHLKTSNFQGSGTRLGGLESANHRVPLDKYDRALGLAALENRLKASELSSKPAFTLEGTHEPPNHRLPILSTIRSCMKGTRTAARAAEIKAAGLKWENESTLPSQPDWNATKFSSSRSRSTMADPDKQEQVVAMNERMRQARLYRALKNEDLNWVPVSNWTLKSSKGTFETLGEYGANWSDESSVPEDRKEKWRMEKEHFSKSGYITMEDVKRLWPDTLGANAGRSSVQTVEELMAWVTDHEQMVKNRYVLMPTTEKQRTSYLGRSGVIEEMERLKRDMRKKSAHKNWASKQMSEARSQQKRAEKIPMRESDRDFKLACVSAFDNLASYLSEAENASTAEEKKTALKKYYRTILAKKTLAPPELEQIYPRLMSGVDCHDFQDTLMTRSDATSGSSDCDATLNPKKLSKAENEKLQEWFFYNAHMWKNGQELALPYSRGSEISRLFTPEELKRGEDLVRRLHKLRTTTQSTTSTNVSGSTGSSLSQHFDDIPFLLSSEAGSTESSAASSTREVASMA